jgi:hypothetical protein
MAGNVYENVASAINAGTPRVPDQNVQDALEAILDAVGVVGILDALSTVCAVKAEHVRESWQDEPLAREWAQLSKITDGATRRAMRYADA